MESSWNCWTISGPITLIGGLSIVTRQQAAAGRATRICVLAFGDARLQSCHSSCFIAFLLPICFLKTV